MTNIPRRTKTVLAVALMVSACGPGGRSGTESAIDASPGGGGGGDGPTGCGNLASCYSVYAHADHILYVVDLQAQTLITVGPFKAPTVGTTEDVITDLAVAPDNTIYVVSETALYSASPTDGHVTRLGSLSACGMRTVALTTTPDGKLWAGDFKGAVCEIDIQVSPPQVKPPIMLTGGFALTGDMVAVADGSVFGTAYKLSDAASQGSQANNLLVKINLATGAVTSVGPTGYPKLFGASFGLGTVMGFTHDGTGHVVKINPATGAGTVLATFIDPVTQMPISFAGAGVSSLVPPIL